MILTIFWYGHFIPLWHLLTYNLLFISFTLSRIWIRMDKELSWLTYLRSQRCRFDYDFTQLFIFERQHVRTFNVQFNLNNWQWMCCCKIALGIPPKYHHFELIHINVEKNCNGIKDQLTWVSMPPPGQSEVSHRLPLPSYSKVFC